MTSNVICISVRYSKTFLLLSQIYVNFVAYMQDCSDFVGLETYRNVPGKTNKKTEIRV